MRERERGRGRGRYRDRDKDRFFFFFPPEAACWLQTQSKQITRVIELQVFPGWYNIKRKGAEETYMCKRVAAVLIKEAELAEEEGAKTSAHMSLHYRAEDTLNV